MKNVTLSIPDDILRKSREYANKQGTTLNQMIRNFLTKTVNADEDDFEKKIKKSIELIGSVDTKKLKDFSREDLHER